MKTKQLLTGFIAAALVAGAFSGCEKAKKENADSGELTKVTTSDSYPIKTDVTLRYWKSLSPNISAYATSMNDTAFHDFLEEDTGIKIKFEHPVSGQEAQAFNLLLNSDDLPDIIEYAWSSYANGPQKAIDEGIIVPLNSYFDKVSPNVKKYLDAHPDLAVQLMTDEGNYYQYPAVRDSDDLLVFMTYIIRKDLLDKAGLDVPESFDEWNTALYKFKEMGVETPLSIQLTNKYLDTFSPFTGVFGFAGTFYHDENNKVRFGPYEPEFADYVRQLRKWYDDGILDREFVNTDAKRLSAMVTNGRAGAISATIGGEFGNYLSAIPENSKIKFVPTKIPTKEKGKRAMYSQKDWPIKDGAAISATSKHKEIAARLLDYGYSEQGRILFNFGREGDTFNYEDTKWGKAPVYTPKVVDSKENGGLTVAQGMSKYIRAYAAGPFIQDVGYIHQYYRRPEQQMAFGIWDSDTLNYKMPILYFNAEEQKKYTDIMTPIDTYREETLAKLVTGKLDLSYLDEYFSELKRMGIEDAISLKQAAYDRYLKRLAEIEK